MHPWQLAIYGVIGFAMSVLSGIAGAGAGFVMTPLAIVLGLTPAQAISSGKFNGLATTIGSLTSLRKYAAKIDKRRIVAVMALALVVGLLVPYVIRSFNNQWYRLTLGVILLLMIPAMLVKKVGIQQTTPTPAKKTLGGILLAMSLFLQGAFSGGLGSLVNVVLMGMLGQTANEAHITKRWSQLILNITIIFSLIGSRLIVWPVVAIGVTASLVGSYLGGKVAVKKGDGFVINVLLVLMGISALVLIVGAL